MFFVGDIVRVMEETISQIHFQNQLAEVVKVIGPWLIVRVYIRGEGIRIRGVLSDDVFLVKSGTVVTDNSAKA